MYLILHNEFERFSNYIFRELLLKKAILSVILYGKQIINVSVYNLIDGFDVDPNQ